MIDLRLWNYYPSCATEEGAKEFIDIIKKYPGCCDTVWLTALSGWPALEDHKKEAERILPIAALFREAGINVSLQFACTLGHGVAHTGADRTGLFQMGEPEYMFGPNGERADYSFCWYGEKFRKYFEETAKLYAHIMPGTVWFDDDLRTTNHLPAEFGCFCDRCIDRFNQNWGTAFTREELVHEINYGDLVWRERWIEQTKDGIRSFSTMIAKAILEISPDSIMAVEYGRAYTYTGSDYNYLFDALHELTGKNVRSRPGGGFYWDRNPGDMLKKALEINFANFDLPDYVVDNYPEIESLPSVAFGKSYDGNCKEATLYLAYGCTGLTFAANDRGQEYPEYDEKLLRHFARYRPYWDRLIEVSRTTKCGGTAVYFSENSHLLPLKEGDEPFEWTKQPGVGDTSLMRIGLPVSYDQKAAKVLILYPDAVSRLTGGEIEELLKKPVIAGGDTLLKLFERGYGDRFGVTVENLTGTDCRGREYYTDHPVNGESAGGWCNESFFIKFGQPAAQIMKGDGIEPLGRFVRSDDKKEMGFSSGFVTTFDKDGAPLAKWAVFGYDFWLDIISSKKRDQIIGAADHLCGNTLPAKLLSHEQVAVIPRVDKDGKTVSVTLQSCSMGRTEALQLLIRAPKSKAFTFMSPYDAEQPLPFTETEDGILVSLPAVEPYGSVTVFC